MSDVSMATNLILILCTNDTKEEVDITSVHCCNSFVHHDLVCSNGKLKIKEC